MGGWLTLLQVSEMFRNTTLLSVVCTIAEGSGAFQHCWRNVWKPTRNPFVPRFLQTQRVPHRRLTLCVNSTGISLSVSANLTKYWSGSLPLRGKSLCILKPGPAMRIPCHPLKKISKCLPCLNSSHTLPWELRRSFSASLYILSSCSVNHLWCIV